MTTPSKFVAYCEPCGFRRVSESQDFAGLTKIPVAPVVGGIPVAEKGSKVVKKPDIVPLPKFKCPTCGRGIVVRKLTVKEASGK